MILPRRLITSWGKMELITNFEAFLSSVKIDNSLKMIQNNFLTPLANAIIPQSVAKVRRFLIIIYLLFLLIL